ncbi:crtp1, partial [Symbiodinium necroappetens]
MAAYGPPIAGPVTFEMATRETTSCPQVVTTFPWPGEVNVKPGLDYIVLHFDRCVRLHGKETATLFGSGFELPSLSDAVCRHDLVSASLPVPEAPLSVSVQDLKLDFCVKWPSPKATTWLHDDRFLQVVFNAAVNLNGTSRRIQLRAGPEADAIPEGGPGQEAPERVTALFTLQPSKRLYWMYGDGNFTSGVGTVEDNMDGTGSLLEQPVYCTHVPHGQAAGIQTCEDHRSYEVDICEVEGNCPDKEKLPCGMILEADFQAGMAISRGVVSRTMTQTHHTRGCHPPELVKTL